MYEEGLALFRELDHKWGIAESLNALGHLAYGQGDQERARALLEESMALTRGPGEKRLLAHALAVRGLVALAQGQHAQAAILYKESLALHQELHYQWGIAWDLEGLARAATPPGASSSALAHGARLLAAATALRAATGSPRRPGEQADYERTVAALRNALGAAPFEAAWAEGQALTLDQAVALARDAAP
jgi:tetratricopeptide (TPR) repeat protein